MRIVSQSQVIPADATMITPARLFSLQALDFVARCRSDLRSRDLVEAFLSLVDPFGIEQVAVVDTGRAAPDLGAAIRFTTFRPEWIRAYIRDRCDRHDAIWHAAMRSGHGHLWSRTLAEAGEEGNWVARRYRKFGLLDGMTVPILNPSAQRSAVFLGASRALQLDPVSEAALMFAAGAFGAVVTASVPAASTDTPLTQREREVLTWTALGKSAGQIGVILDLSEKTIARHLLNIRSKLHCANTVQAVARAVQEGIIVL